MLEKNVFMPLVGLLVLAYGLVGIKTGQMEMTGSTIWSGITLPARTAQIIATIYTLAGLLMFVSALLSWVIYGWQEQLCSTVWMIALAASIGIHTVALFISFISNKGEMS